MVDWMMIVMVVSFLVGFNFIPYTKTRLSIVVLSVGMGLFAVSMVIDFNLTEFVHGLLK